MKKIATTMLLVAAMALGINAQNRYEKISNCVDIYNALLRELAINYVDSIDYDKITADGLTRMLYELDPYTVFYAESEEESLKRLTTGIYGGIGAQVTQHGDYVVIAEPLEGKPAYQNDIHAGDTILSVDGKDAKGLKVSEVSEKLRGPQGSIVEVTLKRPGVAKPIRKKIVRGSIQTDAVAFSAMLDNGIGYIAFSDFIENSSVEFEKALDELNKTGELRKLVIDLRSNGGGLISEATKIASLFVPRNTKIVEVKGLNQKNNSTYKTDKEPLYPNLPLAVIIDSETASAAEILSGALQDLDRAVIIGERSFGKGLVQNIRTLPHNSYAKITIAKYYIPSGRCVQAIDYAKRDANGRLQRIPDSLTHEFSTLNGRKVRDGGGILPDVQLDERDTKSATLLYHLLVKHTMMDYATQFVLKHKTIAPADEFVITDEIFDDFVTFVKAQNFEYPKQSTEILKDLREALKDDNRSEEAEPILAQIDSLLQSDIESDLQRARAEIDEYLGNEIVGRYYYQKGKYAYNTRFDDWLKQTKDLLNDEERYKEILNGK